MKDLPLDSTDLTWLTGLARALLRETHAADDLVQETAVAAMEGSLPANAPRRAWLASVARRLAARRFRSEARRSRREELAASPEALPDSTELVAKAEIAEHVTAAARRLPEPYRRTILLRFLEGRSPEQIAREEKKPVDTVRWRVRRGLDLLREELVRRHGREWSSWSVLLLPLARTHGDAGLATAGASGVLSGTVVSLAAMKVTIAMTAVLGFIGAWLVWDESVESGSELFVADSTGDAVQVTSASNLEAEPTTVGSTSERAVVPTEAPVELWPADFEQELFGQVVDEAGEPVADATVYLMPVTEERGSQPVLARTESDAGGAFRFSPEDWKSDADSGEPALDLGVVANGFLRTVVPNVMSASRDELLVVLARGETLAGRVVDELGRPVSNLELLVYSASAGVSHVSPSQRLLRAQRRQVAGASSSYDHCRATTNGRGEVVFTGLPAGKLNILPLDPGWTIEDSSRVEADDSYIVWTVQRRLGVRLSVIDRGTGRPAERAAAVFRFELTFADGEVRDFGQWVGRGAGEVSFVLDPELLPGLEERTIIRADFYGTARSGEGVSVDWFAEPIENTAGAVGVVEVLVDAEPAPVAADAAGEERTVEETGTASLLLDVSYEDSAPFEGELEVSWTTEGAGANRGKARAEVVGIGRYRLDVPAGELSLEVSDRFSYGSLPSWKKEVRYYADQEATAFVTLPRGASATVSRPEGWRGEWFVHASWRSRGAESWQGSWGFSTDGSSMTLPALRSGEWRFELRRYSALEGDPIVRTVLLEKGESVIVDE